MTDNQRIIFRKNVARGQSEGDLRYIWTSFWLYFLCLGTQNLPNDNIGFVQVGRTEVTELLEYYFSFVLLPSSWFSKPHLHKAGTR
jgi:hypothetical protein